MSTSNLITSISGTDIDTKELVTNLIAAVREPRQKLIDAEKKRAEVALSTTALVKNALQTLQNAATAIGSVSALNKVKITSSDENIISATRSQTGTADPGSISVAVNELAKETRRAIYLTGNLTADQVPTDGSFKFQKAGQEVLIDVAIGDSPAELAAKINSSNALKALGIKATVLTTKDANFPYVVSIAGNTGESQNFTIDTDGANLTVEEKQLAQDAEIVVNGISVKRETNLISDLIDGVTVKLHSKAVGEQQLNIIYDSEALVESANNFVDSFNIFSDVIKSATGQKVPGDDLAGSLPSDPTAKAMMSKLRSILTNASSSAAGDYTHLSKLGIEFTREGKLQLNEEKFKRNFEASPKEAIKMLSDNSTSPRLFADPSIASGIAGDVARAAYLFSKPTGSLTKLSESWTTKQSAAEERQQKLEDAMDRLQAQYEKQYDALNSILAQMKNTQSQLESSLNLQKDN